MYVVVSMSVVNANQSRRLADRVDNIIKEHLVRDMGLVVLAGRAEEGLLELGWSGGRGAREKIGN